MEFCVIMPPLCVTNELATAFCAWACVDLSTRGFLESRLLLEDRLYCSVVPRRRPKVLRRFCLSLFLVSIPRCAAPDHQCKIKFWSTYDLNYSFECHPYTRRTCHFP